MAYTETYRAVVAPADCDHLGHMNVSRYFAACSDAVCSLQVGLGLTRADVLTGRQLAFAVVRAESDFRAELLVGEAVAMESGIVAFGTKSALIHHRLHSVDDGRLAFESLFRSVLLDLRARKAVPVPDDVRAAAAPFMVPAPG